MISYGNLFSSLCNSVYTVSLYMQILLWIPAAVTPPNPGSDSGKLICIILLFHISQLHVHPVFYRTVHKE